ncbi:hypothetical protein [Lacticaseibacillus yichunensis]|uniref:Uncharacterized protein n=1 Tax=Lacticaseibacillus yichunensis TaxID=2486015 RepID=A0ABW4CS59_9LACO|nr:hypothetical protein [Lacticaseibacillus yichunensis]
MTLFYLIFDIGLLALGGYYLFWLSRMDIHARYSGFQLVIAVLVGLWLLAGGIDDIAYVIFVAAFVTLTVLTGTSGLTPTRLISVGVFGRVIPLSRMTAVTLTPFSVADGRTVVIALFTMGDRRLVRLSFASDLQTLIAQLQPRLPQQVPITVEHLE